MKRVFKRDGFTLIELAAVLVIVGLLYGLVIPRFSDITGLRLKSETRKIASLVKFAYDEAVAKNKKLRLAFDLTQEKHRVTIEEWIQRSSATIFADDDDQVKTLTEKEEEEKDRIGRFEPLSKDRSKNLVLPSYIKIKGIYIYSEKKLVDREGSPDTDEADTNSPSAALVFLPSGFTEDSIIYVSDEKDRVYSIKVNPITGRPTVFNYYVEPEKT